MYLMFLKMKSTSIVKARGCVDGVPQREFIGKEESKTPTVSIYALMGISVMNMIEERKIITMDIPSAFSQSDGPNNKPTYLKFDRIIVDMLCEINPSLKENIFDIKSRSKLMYGWLQKVVYDILLGMILLYNQLTSQLIE